MALQNIRNFKLANPATPEQLHLKNKLGVMFLKSDDGLDWYECQKLFQSDTIKLCYDEKNIIRSISSADSGHDVSGLWPVGYSVAEVKNTTANRRADIHGGWLYMDGEIVRREATLEELIASAEAEKQSRIAQANEYINNKQWPGKAAMGRLKDTEKGQYNEWLDYLDALDAVDTSFAPEIDWPVKLESA
ncbi:tail fiber assembly protein [Cedecea neteri]|uniref:tail fiber assembly protein n=1 Tax=Cedecea neteri TaxID=158822 RepID=UPI0004F89117|nr:tail fiber assembly protein [Cedecea neteri]AIR65082.1 hypothetical protein LH86_08295 [Cedecea neteri]